MKNSNGIPVNLQGQRQPNYDNSKNMYYNSSYNSSFDSSSLGRTESTGAYNHAPNQIDPRMMPYQHMHNNNNNGYPQLCHGCRRPVPSQTNADSSMSLTSSFEAMTPFPNAGPRNIGKQNFGAMPSPSHVERVIGQPLLSSSPKSSRERESAETIEHDYEIDLATDNRRGSAFKLRKVLGRGVQQNTTVSKVSSTAPRYLGATTRAEAELTVTRPTTFNIYHRAPVYGIPQSDTLKLFVCYLSSSRNYHHIPIVREELGEAGPMYRVDSNSGRVPLFPSVEQLVKYYTTYVHIRTNRKTGDVLVDVFNTSRASVNE